jgi:histidyl-tRNA synthetase
MRHSAPKGTFDVLPPDGESVLQVRRALESWPARAGYRYLETPVFEDTALFVRGVGGSTDVVTKEMYSFTTKGGDEVTLRPEGTASVMRAALEHSLPQRGVPVKVWYSGSFFRYERPQAGRYRHFTQVGAEAIGSDDPALDAELIVLAVDAYRALGLRNVRVLLNSLGDADDRPAYRAALVAYLERLDLDDATRARVAINPLRVLDDKRPEVQAQLVDAPLVIDHLGPASRAHFDQVRGRLADAGVEWEDAPRLVRGLDYYTRTAFEFVHDGLGAQSAIGGGGRYDGLSEALGGPALPAVGWALGVERTLLALAAEGVAPDAASACDVYVVPIGEAAADRAFSIVADLRRAGHRVDLAVDGRGLKGAMKAADRSGARVALILGERDLADEVVQRKDLVTGEQIALPLDGLEPALSEYLISTLPERGMA